MPLCQARRYRGTQAGSKSGRQPHHLNSQEIMNSQTQKGQSGELFSKTTRKEGNSRALPLCSTPTHPLRFHPYSASVLKDCEHMPYKKSFLECVCVCLLTNTWCWMIITTTISQLQLNVPTEPSPWQRFV